MYMNQAWIWQPTMGSNHNHHYFQFEQEQDQGSYSYRKEHMFEKPLTPSDVGKLNRLVIPKQHAEKHFPLDSESGEKGLLLSFEDESGKSWNFRYSYWTSSQSYVLTKGWSRYVKEKKLDAGDVVLFERCRFGSRSDDRLYIGCRRRVSNETATPSASVSARSPSFYAAGASTPYAAPYYYMSPVNSGDQAASSMDNTVAVATTGNSRRLRLFGVNLECGPDPEEPDQHLVSGAWNQFMPTNASTSQL